MSEIGNQLTAKYFPRRRSWKLSPCGTRVLTKTGNLAAVMKTMGHKDVRAAMQYQHPELELVRAALNQGREVAPQMTA